MKNTLIKIVVSSTILLLIAVGNSVTAGNNKLKTDSIVLNQSYKEEKIYSVVEQMPQFPGGESELLRFINSNIRYPIKAQEWGIKGRVILRFVVTRSGKVDKVEVVRSLDRDCDKEAVRVIKLLPDFIPGKQKGENVAVWYILPVDFNLL